MAQFARIKSRVLTLQKNSRRLWRFRRRKSSSVPAGAANFPAAVSLPESAQTLAGLALRIAGRSGNHFPAASKFGGKPFQQGISDTHSLLDFLKIIRARQRSGEGVVRRNGCPKGCFGRVRFFSAPLRFAPQTPERS